MRFQTLYIFVMLGFVSGIGSPESARAQYGIDGYGLGLYVPVDKQLYLDQVEEIAAALDDADQAKRMLAVLALGDLPARSEKLTRVAEELLRRGSPESFAASTYMQPNAFHAETIVPALEALLRNTVEKGSSRSRVAEALARYKKAGTVAVPVLLELLETETDQDLRRNTIRALGSLGAAAYPAVPRFAELLHAPEPGLTQSLVLAIRGIGPPAATALPELISLLESGSTAAKPRYVLEAIGSIGPAARSAEDVVLNYTDDSDSSVHEYALEALRKIGADSPRTVEVLRRSLQEKGFARYEAFTALQSLGPVADEAAPDLIPYFRDWSAADDAAKTMGALGRGDGRIPKERVSPVIAEAVHLLVGLLSHSDPGVAEAASDALVDLADASVGPMAFALTTGRVQVVDALGGLPEPHHFALLASLRHPDARVREAAARGLAHYKYDFDEEVLLPLNGFAGGRRPGCRLGGKQNTTFARST